MLGPVRAQIGGDLDAGVKDGAKLTARINACTTNQLEQRVRLIEMRAEVQKKQVSLNTDMEVCFRSLNQRTLFLTHSVIGVHVGLRRQAGQVTTTGLFRCAFARKANLGIMTRGLIRDMPKVWYWCPHGRASPCLQTKVMFCMRLLHNACAETDDTLACFCSARHRAATYASDKQIVFKSYVQVSFTSPAGGVAQEAQTKHLQWRVQGAHLYSTIAFLKCAAPTHCHWPAASRVAEGVLRRGANADLKKET